MPWTASDRVVISGAVTGKINFSPWTQTFLFKHPNNGYCSTNTQVHVCPVL